MSSWKEYKLGEIADIQNGFAFKSKDFASSGIPIIKIKNIVTPSVVLDETSYFNGIIDSNLKKFIVKKGDFLISMTGSTVNQMASAVGKMGKYPFEKVALLNQRVGKIYSKSDEVLDEFLYYLLNRKEVQYNLAVNASGSANQANISPDQIKNLKFNFPPLTNQKAIAEILSSLDDKIELNNHINQNLEALAQAIFKQWFVDFEFPNENGEPYKSSGGEMVDSELGEIPKGWEVKSLDEIAEYLNGLALQKFRPKNENDPSLPVIKIKELRQGYANGEEKASMEIDKKYKIQDGDILFSWSGSLLVDFWTGGEGALNQHLFKVSSKTYSKWFIFLWTKFHLQEFQKIAEGKATTMGHIQRKHLSDARVLVPPRDLLEKFTETFENIIEEIISSRLESRKLMNLRDTLLPKLISGELEVNQIEKEVYG